MPSTVPRELMSLAERVVRPLPLPFERQKRLREDYLEHLQGIYLEELARQRDPVAALNRVQQRFGDPVELTAELRQGIRWWELWQAKIQAALSPRPGESLSWYAGRMTGWFFVVMSVMFALITVDHHFFGVEQVSFLKVKTALLVVAFVSSWLGCLLLFGLHAGDAWEHQPRQWFRIIALSLAHLASWPLSLMMLMFIAGGSWSDYSIPLLASVLGGLFSVACGIVVGSMHCRDMRYRRQWSELDLQAE